ncbi:hypothetical protein FRC10_008280 [Ceratobasidium sp. 414]|nr:hypothetical protein FRC10_008280 [Ceratobasidium sp. 414]
MSGYACECSAWSNDALILKEISHRRSIASYLTSLTLTAGATVGTMGAVAPLTVPVSAFKLYKIKSHRSKLDLVRAELARRHLLPVGKRTCDVLLPVAMTCMVYVATLGIADIIDFVPSDVQGMFEGHTEGAVGVAPGSVGGDCAGDTYQAFLVAEAASPWTKAEMHPTSLPPGQSFTGIERFG